MTEPKERKGLLDEIEDVAAKRSAKKEKKPAEPKKDDDLDLGSVW